MIEAGDFKALSVLTVERTLNGQRYHFNHFQVLQLLMVKIQTQIKSSSTRCRF